MAFLAGIGHLGFSQDGSITRNVIMFNQSFQQTNTTHGGGIMVSGEPAVAGTLSLGTGNVTIDANLIRGNFAEAGHGGGVRLQQVNGADVAAFPRNQGRWFAVTMTNNMIVNNVAGWAGGGIALADTLASTVDNNTIAANDSVGIAGVVLAGGVPLPGATTATAGRGRPNPAGISSDPTSSALRNVDRSVAAISSPELINNIVWKNRAFFYSGDNKLCTGNSTADVGLTCNVLPDQATTGQEVAGAKYWDLGVLGDASVVPGATRLNPAYSVLTSTTGYNAASAHNTNANPNLADMYFNGSRVTPEYANVINPPSVKNLQVSATVDEGNNYVNLRYGPLYLSKPSGVPFGDYHIASAETSLTSSAVDHGTNSGVARDYDGDVRPVGPAYDIGADELRVPVAVASLSPTSLAFGNQGVNSSSAARSITLTNTGTANLVIASITLGTPGTNANQFAQTNTCPTGGTGLAPSASCTINVTFTPSSSGSKSATLSINDNATPSPQQVSLSGTGTVLQGTVSFDSATFGTLQTVFGVRTLAFGNQSGAVSSTVTLRNSGTAPINFTSATVGNLIGTAFSKTDDTCSGTTVAVGGTCSITVQFVGPAGNSARLGSLTMVDNATGSPQLLGLSGN